MPRDICYSSTVQSQHIMLFFRFLPNNTKRLTITLVARVGGNVIHFKQKEKEKSIIYTINFHFFNRLFLRIILDFYSILNISFIVHSFVALSSDFLHNDGNFLRCHEIQVKDVSSLRPLKFLTT